MSTVQDTAANDPRLNVETKDLEKPVKGVVLPDWNQTELPEGYSYYAYPQIDNNADSGVVIDQNVVPKEEREEGAAPPDPEVNPEPPPDPESFWIGDRRSSDAIDLPHSRYKSPDLSFKDPEDVEEPYEAVGDDLPLRPRLREPL